MTVTHSARKGAASRPPSVVSEAIPRDVRLTAAGAALTVVAVVMAIGAIASAIGMSVAYAQAEDERQRRDRERTPIEAEIVDVVSRRGEHPRRLVTYRFEADGRSYTGNAKLPQRDRRDTAHGAPLSIEYVRSQPEANWVAGYEPRGFPFWIIPLVSIALLFSSALTARSVRRQWTLLSEGRMAQARVTAHKRLQTDKQKGYRVACEFQDLSGATRTARFDTGKNPPPVGAAVPIVYHRDNPRWNAAYPLPLVRVARPA